LVFFLSIRFWAVVVVTESEISPAAEVRAQFRRVKPLKDISVTQRGWTLDVLNVVRRLCEAGTPRRGVCGRLGQSRPYQTNGHFGEMPLPRKTSLRPPTPIWRLP
jgi:hypothetical protein